MDVAAGMRNIYIEKMFILVPERITKLLYLGFLDILVLPTNILVLVVMIMQV